MNTTARNIIRYTGMFSLVCAGWLFGDYTRGLPLNHAIFPLAIIGVILATVSVFYSKS